MIYKRVFFRHIFVQDGIKLWPFLRELWKFKCAPFLEADKKNTLAVLRHDALCVNDFVKNSVTERIGQRVMDDLKRAALVMAFEILHILQNKSRRFVNGNNFGDGKEKVALFFVIKAVCFAETQFF